VNHKIFEDKIFEKVDPIESFIDLEFDHCTFKNCDFTDKTLTGNDFIHCKFILCNLSMVKWEGSSLNDVTFSNCKILGVDFSKCSKFLFSVAFEDCILNYSYFYKSELKNTIFKNCVLQEVNFSEANLFNVKFINCDLANAIFERTNLEKADFTLAKNYSFKLESNKIKKAKFSVPEVLGIFNSYDIIISD
jgi:uncharacterized protein YjbI with pentapeptide repeats